MSFVLFGLAHLWLFGVVRPFATWREHRREGRSLTTLAALEPHYRRGVVIQATYAGISLLTVLSLWLFSRGTSGTARIFVLNTDVATQRQVWSGLFPAEWPEPASWWLGLAALVGMLAIDLPYARWSSRRGQKQAYITSPRTTRERAWWCVLAVTTGVGEELTWRGVQPELLAQLTGALWPAVLICTVTFGFGHIRNGVLWAVAAGLFGLILHGLALVTGSLYVGIAVHGAVNVVSGLYQGTQPWKPAT